MDSWTKLWIAKHGCIFRLSREISRVPLTSEVGLTDENGGSTEAFFKPIYSHDLIDLAILKVKKK